MLLWQGVRIKSSNLRNVNASLMFTRLSVQQLWQWAAATTSSGVGQQYQRHMKVHWRCIGHSARVCVQCVHVRCVQCTLEWVGGRVAVCLFMMCSNFVLGVLSCILKKFDNVHGGGPEHLQQTVTRLRRG